MAGGGRRPGAGRPKSDVLVKTRRELTKRLPEALKSIDAILANPEHPQHFSVCKMVIDRTLPALKPESALIEFELDESSPSSMARSIVKGASDGKISASAAVELLNAMASTMKIIEVSELEERIRALEE